MNRAWPLALGLMLSSLALGSVDHYDVNDGLSQNSVVAIETDTRGFVWLGTEDGLNRFDGNEFRVYRADPQRLELPDGFIQRLDRTDEVLWIGTIGSGLARMHLLQERIEGLRTVLPDAPPANLSVQAMASLSATRILVGTAEGLFDVRWPEAGAASATVLSLESAGIGESVRTVVPLRDQRTLVGTDRGACLHDSEQRRCDAVVGLGIADRVMAALEDAAGTLWISVDQLGLVRLRTDGAVDRVFAFDQELPAGVARILSMADGGDGTLWLGTDQGAYPWRSDCQCTGLRVDADDQMAVESHRKLVYSLKADGGGKLWIGAWNHGLDRYDPQRQAISRHQVRVARTAADESRAVRAISSDSEGVWIGTYGQGALRANADGPGYDYQQPAALVPKSVAEGLIWSLLQIDQRLWIGSDAGLRWWQLDRQQLSEPVQLRKAQELQEVRSVRSMMRDRQGRIWIGGESGLVRISQPQAALPLADPVLPEPPDARVFALHEDRAGRVWIGTWSGVYGYSQVGDPLGELAPDARIRVVWDIADAAADSGGLWVGSSDGLIWVGDDGRWRRYTEADGLANRVIYAIEADDQGMLWLSSNRGIMRFDPRSGAVINFGLRDQLQHIEFMFGSHAKDLQGRLLFGGARGFNRIDPAQVASGDLAPRPQLTGVLVDGREVGAADPRVSPAVAAPSIRSLRLFAGDSVVELRYGAIAFDQPRELRFRYRLHGFDLRWQEADKRRYASYTNLPPGQYQFQIEAISRFGTPSVAPRSLDIEVLPHWYQTRWFQALLLMMVLASIALLLQWRVRQLEARKRVLEAQVAERTLEIRSQRDALDRQHAELQRINAELAALSSRDSLTGLYNRRALLEQLELCRTQAQPGTDLAVALVDLDHFKRINDHHGHAAGDAALIHLARLWEPLLPESAVFGRYGGEEFLLILPGHPLTAANAICESLIAQLRAHPMTRYQPQIALRASVGVARFDGSEHVAQLLQRADAALYQAKHGGRDRVVAAR